MTTDTDTPTRPPEVTAALARAAECVAEAQAAQARINALATERRRCIDVARSAGLSYAAISREVGLSRTKLQRDQEKYAATQ